MSELSPSDAAFLRQGTTAITGDDLDGGTGGPRSDSPAPNRGGIAKGRGGGGVGVGGAVGDVGGSDQRRHQRDCSRNVLDAREGQAIRLGP